MATVARTRSGSAAKKPAAKKAPAKKPAANKASAPASEQVDAPRTRAPREEPQTPNGCAIGVMSVVLCLGMSAVILLGGGLSKAIDRALPAPRPAHAAPVRKAAPAKAPARAETGALTCEQLIERGMGWACGGPK